MFERTNVTIDWRYNHRQIRDRIPELGYKSSHFVVAFTPMWGESWLEMSVYSGLDYLFI